MSGCQDGYPIRKVSELTGLSQRQIRYYEQKGLVCPRRTQGGQRVFLAHDIEKLERIRDLLQAGYPLTVIEGILQGNNPELTRRRRLAHLVPARGTDVGSIFPVRDQAKLYDLLTKYNPLTEGKSDDDTRGNS